MKLIRSVFASAGAAVLALAGLVAAPAAQARGDVVWSVGIGAPGVSVGVSNAYPVYSTYPSHPVYATPAPVYVQPAPVYVQPRPIYYQPAPVYVQPAPVYVRPAPIYWDRGDRHRHGHGHGRGHRHDGRGYGHGR